MEKVWGINSILINGNYVLLMGLQYINNKEKKPAKFNFFYINSADQKKVCPSKYILNTVLQYCLFGFVNILLLPVSERFIHFSKS